MAVMMLLQLPTRLRYSPSPDMLERMQEAMVVIPGVPHGMLLQRTHVLPLSPVLSQAFPGMLRQLLRRRHLVQGQVHCQGEQVLQRR